LLPTTLAPKMTATALKVAQEYGCSIGYSPDDGGVGDLDMRRVICVSPDKIGTGISQAWYDQYYPDVLFVPIAFASSPADLERQLKTLF
ncbi:MAG TPA: hypothetical protein PKH77_05770, partial [Anaerolineae bacterium]|nr:hypothetical protein [Anaerolineae bacterium]